MALTEKKGSRRRRWAFKKPTLPRVSGYTLFASVLVGVALLGLGLLAFDQLVLPSNAKTSDGKSYDYGYSAGRSENIDFMVNNMSSNSYLCFGSSEWHVGKDLVSMCPQAVFGESSAGVNMTYIGEAYDQDLWQAIAAGAYGSNGNVKNRKVVLVVSPQWFFKGSGEQKKFKSKFSYTLYRAFMQSSSVSDETKAYVRKRCAALGIDSSKLAAASHDTALDAINDAVYAKEDSWKLRSELVQTEKSAPKKSLSQSCSDASSATNEPDWNALLAKAQTEGEAACTNNDLGIYDAYWNKYKDGTYEKDQSFSDADDEYNDLKCFLQVCKEVGFEPMVVILPIHGQWYDQNNVSTEERQAYYQKIRTICSDAGATYADFSAYEYEKYFLCDTTHPGWKGWVRIEHAFFDFVTEKRGQDDCITWGSDSK